ncbi:MAG: protein PhnA [Planctomycetota bacterium]|jgi:protein PhnA
MGLEETLRTRAGSKCELCEGETDLSIHLVSASPGPSEKASVLACSACRAQLEGSSSANPNHWRCLNVSMWSEVPAVQVLAWRMLKQLESEDWARDLLETLYLEDKVLNWAQAGAPEGPGGGPAGGTAKAIRHRDSNGAQLATGDTVTLIKDLVVKGAGFTAKRGTVVRGIALVEDNTEHIEGRVNGQHIVLLTQFVKKST